jgi:hypothetical protein
MKNKRITIGIIVVAALIAIVTNPGQDKHREFIKTKLNASMQKLYDANADDTAGQWGKAGQAPGVMFGGAIVNQIVDNLVHSDNYVLFSLTKITWQGETGIIGIGAYGNVFITKKLDEALDKGLLDTRGR